MKKITWGDYMEGKIIFTSKEDEKACVEHWKNNNELTVDEYGRVYNEGNQYVADIEVKDE